jgi:trans-2-enoyl-CoA reductase
VHRFIDDWKCVPIFRKWLNYGSGLHKELSGPWRFRRVQSDFHNLFGFGFDGVDYEADADRNG